MLQRLGCLVILLPFLELYLLLKLGQWIGALPTVGLVIGTALLGIWILKFESRRLSLQMQSALNHGQPPIQQISDAAALMMAGVLLILPGPLSDILGLVLWIPITRRPLMVLLNHAWLQRMTARFQATNGPQGTVWVTQWSSPNQAANNPYTTSQDVIEGEYEIRRPGILEVDATHRPTSQDDEQKNP